MMKLIREQHAKRKEELRFTIGRIVLEADRADRQRKIQLVKARKNELVMFSKRLMKAINEAGESSDKPKMKRVTVDTPYGEVGFLVRRKRKKRAVRPPEKDGKE